MANSSWSLLSLCIVSVSLISFYIWYEKRETSVKEMALIATLSAFVGLSRVPFAAIPSLQPTTFFTLLIGYVFGMVPGFMVGSLSVLVSNIFLGHGPWTPWQMVAWGLVGISGGLMGRRKGKVKFLMFAGAILWGFLYGFILNIWHWLTFVYPLTIKTLIASQLTGIWFDSIHAFGNGVFMYFLGEDLIKVLQRFKKRLRVIELDNIERG